MIFIFFITLFSWYVALDKSVCKMTQIWNVRKKNLYFPTIFFTVMQK